MVPSKRIQQFVLNSTIPIICSIVVGFLFFSKYFFEVNMPTFQFVTSAAIASLFYYMMLFFQSRRAYIGLFFLLILDVVVSRSSTPVFILRDVLYVAAIGISMVIFIKFFRQNRNSSPLYCAVTLAGLYPLVNTVTAELDLVLLRPFDAAPRVDASYFLATMALLDVLIGFAVGAGITLSEKILGPVDIPIDEPMNNGSGDDPD